MSIFWKIIKWTWWIVALYVWAVAFDPKNSATPSEVLAGLIVVLWLIGAIGVTIAAHVFGFFVRVVFGRRY